MDDGLPSGFTELILRREGEVPVKSSAPKSTRSFSRSSADFALPETSLVFRQQSGHISDSVVNASRALKASLTRYAGWEAASYETATALLGSEFHADSLSQ